MELRNLEWLAAADVGAGELVVAAHHVRLRLGKARAVAFIGIARQLGPLAPNYPAYLILAGLPALGAGKRVLPHFSCLVEEFAFFHFDPALGCATPLKESLAGLCRFKFPLKLLRGGFRFASISSILILAMTKRKPTPFSATKAVKANARERVGQPKPARVVESEPRTGRETKHKPKLEEIILQEE